MTRTTLPFARAFASLLLAVTTLAPFATAAQELPRVAPDDAGFVPEREGSRNHRMFEPLDMRDTHFYLPPGKEGRLASVHGHGAEGKLVRSPEGPGMHTQGQYATGPRTSFSGGAGLLSTARDYGRFLQMMLNGGTLGDARILSPASVELMTANHVGDLMGNGNVSSDNQDENVATIKVRTRGRDATSARTMAVAGERGKWERGSGVSGTAGMRRPAARTRGVFHRPVAARYARRDGAVEGGFSEG